MLHRSEGGGPAGISLLCLPRRPHEAPVNHAGGPPGMKNIDSSFFKTMLIKHTIMGLNDNELNKLVGVVSVFWTQWKWFKIDLILDHTAQIRSDQSLSCVRLFVTP